MKKTVAFGLLVVLLAGCGRGWLPLYRGAPCCGKRLWERPLLMRPFAPRCNDCENAAGYGAYNGEIITDQVEGALPPVEYYESPLPPAASGATEMTPLPAPEPSRSN